MKNPNRRGCHLLAGLISLATAGLWAAPKAGAELLLKWEMCPARTLYLYHDVDAKAARFRPIIDFKDVPAGSRWYVENNSYGIMAYTAGLRLNDPKLMAYGTEILDFAIRQQTANGEFPEKRDLHHSAAFFYEIAARFLILSEIKGFADHVPPETLQRLQGGLRKGAIWFGRETSWKDEFWKDDFHHRFLLNASVIMLAQRVAGDLPPETMAQAHRWIQTAVDRQLPNGVMTEKGGHDTGYQSLSITFATGILCAGELVEGERTQLERLVRTGADWLIGRVSAEGEIDGTGNTRMGANSKEINRTDGRPKGIKPYEHAFALVGAGVYFNEPSYMDAADRIMRFYKY